MRPLDTARDVLSKLAARMRGTDAPELGEGFTDLIHVVGDVGRGFATPDEADIRALLPYIGSLREEFERAEYAGAIETTPWRALSADKDRAVPYAAGALWACAAMTEAFVERRHLLELREEDRVSRSDVRDTALSLLEVRGRIRPGDVLEHLAGQDRRVAPSVVSKALGDLLTDGRVRVVEPGEAPDRRHRYYELTEEARDLPNHLLDDLHQLARRTLCHLDAERTRELFAEALVREAGRSHSA